MMLAPVLTPHGLLMLAQSLEAEGEAPALEPERGLRLEKAFARGAGHGLVLLGADEVGTTLSPTLSYWRRLGARYMTALCALPGIGERNKPPVPIPADGELDTMAAAVPPMIGAEYVTTEVLVNLWRGMDLAFDTELAQSKLTVQEFLKRRHPAWNLVGRVHFNLAENRKDEDAPFAFLATYTTRLSAEAKPQHLPLGKALQEYSGARNRERLLSLLMPVQRAAEHCPWLKAMVDAGEIFHPLRWSPQQAVQFLRDVPALESAGVLVRMPASWRMNRPARPQVKATVGGNAPSHLGMDALLDFRMEVTLDGENLTAAEIKRLLAHSDGLALIRGKWVEVDHERLSRTLEQFKAIERRAVTDGLSFGEAMRMLAGAGIAGDGAAGQADVAWSRDRGRPMAGGNARGFAPSRSALACRPRPFPSGHSPAVSAGGRRMALSARTAKTWGVPRRRHGAWQDHPGVVAAAGVEARGRGEAEALPARGAGFAARQLDGGDCPICAKPPGRRRPSISGVLREPDHGGCGQSGGCRLGHYKLWLPGPLAVARSDSVATGGA